MDTKSLHTLEYHKVLNILAGYTSFSAGEELARKLQPTTDQILAEQWQTETAEALLLLDTHTNITIGGARDVRRPAGREPKDRADQYSVDDGSRRRPVTGPLARLKGAVGSDRRTASGSEKAP